MESYPANSANCYCIIVRRKGKERKKGEKKGSFYKGYKVNFKVNCKVNFKVSFRVSHLSPILFPLSLFSFFSVLFPSLNSKIA